jgi:hypothetical protein
VGFHSVCQHRLLLESSRWSDVQKKASKDNHLFQKDDLKPSSHPQQIQASIGLFVFYPKTASMGFICMTDLFANAK